MDALAFEHHLTSPQGHGHTPDGWLHGDRRRRLLLRRDHVLGARRRRPRSPTPASPPAAAAPPPPPASAAVTLVRGAPVLDAARIGPGEIAAELGGLSPGKLHAAELAADALARALGAAVRRAARASRAPTGRRGRWWR